MITLTFHKLTVAGKSVVLSKGSLKGPADELSAFFLSLSSGESSVSVGEEDSEDSDELLPPSLRGVAEKEEDEEEKRRLRIKRGQEALKVCVQAWAENFQQPDTEQPDRIALMATLSQNARGVLEAAYAVQSLQILVYEALWEVGKGSTDLAEQIAANMVQVSTVGFPELAGTYDYTNWRKRHNLENA